MLETPFRLTIAGTLLATSCLVATPALSDERVSVMVFDASGSMWARLEDGKSRIEVAREVIEEFSGSRDSSVPFGVVAYGHNRRGDCADIETVLALGTYSGEEISRTIRELNPQGMTPLTDSMALARDMIPPTAEAADIILVTDGLENCGGDPCALAADIAAEGIDIRAHVVGFALEEEAVQTLSCVSEQTGGQLFTTQSGEELSTALNQIAAPAPEPEEVRVEPELPTAEIHAPDSAPVGSTIEVRWDGPEDESDVITVVEPGAPEGASGHSRRASSRVSGNDSVSIQMPDALGTFELRYVHGETDATLASREIVLEPVEARVSAPEEIGAGARFEVDWEGPVNRNDYVVIVEAGAPDDDTGHGRAASTRVSDSGEPVTIQAPDALGTYEVRYVIRDSRRVIASQEVTLTPVEATVSAPEEISAGARFEVEWEGPVNRNDYVVIVEAGAPDDDTGHGRAASTRVSDSGEAATIQAPDALGTFEVRYVIRDSRRVLASQEVTLTPVEASVSAPEEIGAGARFEVEWEGPVNRNDYVVIVPAGAPDDDTGHGRAASSRVSDSGEAVTIQAPDALGTFEVRYVIRDSRRVLASQEVTLTPVSASLEAPETVLPGSDFEVRWEGPQNRRDFIAVVKPDAPDGDSGDSRSASSRASGDSVTLTAPRDEGDYEIRYVINDSDRTLAAIPITVGGTDASLTVDGPVETGGVVEISFTGPGRFEDLIEIVEAGADPDDSALQDARASQGSPAQLFAPSRAGSYEIRYRASDSGEVLATIPLEVH